MATLLQVLLSLVLLVGGMLLLGLAISSSFLPGPMFVAGILAFSMAFGIPMIVGSRGHRQ